MIHVLSTHRLDESASVTALQGTENGLIHLPYFCGVIVLGSWSNVSLERGIQRKNMVRAWKPSTKLFQNLILHPWTDFTKDNEFPDIRLVDRTLVLCTQRLVDVAVDCGGSDLTTNICCRPLKSVQQQSGKNSAVPGGLCNLLSICRCQDRNARAEQRHSCCWNLGGGTGLTTIEDDHD